ncbi:FkbM family methyltransferase [Rhodoligotrophos appendicifer]|uniref:FkbM family methyltransferase n=1 Tax=Rhodoligotrophos appendicifer TaxID=987056 RepID=UPI0011869A93|nr:FkbM family methyltransferase [Rhodoligotrophos appendicifer]
MAIFRKIAGKTVRALRKLGLHVDPSTNSNGRVIGLRIQWKEDESTITRGAIVKSRIKNRDVAFFVSNELDSIQKFHRAGVFYEMDELELISQHFKGGTFVDVGANIGNHTLYALLALDATKVIAFEPLPLAFSILEINIATNQLGDRATLRQMGLSNTDTLASFTSPTNNLGGSRLLERPDAGGIKIGRGDDYLKDEKVDFIKIDTEGFEIQVLEGLVQTINKNKPVIFVEVEDENISSYESFSRKMGYRVAEKFDRYAGRANYLSVFDPR